MTSTEEIKLKAPTRHKMSRGKIEDWCTEMSDIALQELFVHWTPEQKAKYPEICNSIKTVAYIFFKHGALKMRHEIRQILPFFNIPQDILEKMVEEIDKIGM